MGFNNFSWVIDGRLAGSGIPGGRLIAPQAMQSADLADMRKAGVRLLVSLEKMPPGFRHEAAKAGLSWISYPIRDFEVPSDLKTFAALVDKIIAAMESGAGVCIHCHAGVGRTGLVLACVMGRYFKISGKKAIAAVRKVRTALETDTQVAFVSEFCAEHK